MTDNICEFCGKSFSNIYNLDIHIKSAKYCLTQRGENPSILYPCDHCDSQFTKKSTLTNHLKSCASFNKKMSLEAIDIEKKDKTLHKEIKKLKKTVLQQKVIIDSKQETIKKLQETNKKLRETNKEQRSKIIELEKEVSYGKGMVVGIETGIDKAPKPQMVMNNTNSNGISKITNKKLASIPITHIQPLTEEYIKSRVDEYDYEKYKLGKRGVVQFVVGIVTLFIDGSNQKNYACTDRSRNAFHRLIQNKEWKADGGASYLNTFLDSISGQAEIHYETLDKETKSKRGDIKETEKLMKLEGKLRPIYWGITFPKSKDRKDLFEAIRNDIRDICAITSDG